MKLDDYLKRKEEGKEIYYICVDECKCFVECKNNDDCGKGMECGEEYICVVDREIVERRVVGQVLLTVPLFLCTFGVFSSMFLAKEYGNEYFAKKCKDYCPSTSKSFEFDIDKVEMDVNNENNEDRLFYCNGRCDVVDKKLWEKVVRKVLKDELFGKKFSKIFGVEEESKLFEIGYSQSQKKCKTVLIEDEVISTNLADATSQFAKIGMSGCSLVKYRWMYNRDNKYGVLPLSNLFKKICGIDLTTIDCWAPLRYKEIYD